ncbi:unnamed protein product [Penicillium salamii]|uniref:ABC transporter domain-containing protein n=1 Tax=Penicillium salamii TaxID=1612424 RepID=A0A9W4IWK7_9EURO|nr:unnamed protein product [Penicillium salamii]
MRRVAPTPYALEALMGNEFYNIELHCTAEELIPSGPGYGDLEHQGCPLPGAKPGSRTSSGAYYLSTLYNYSHDHLWRNFGIMLAFWALYTILAAIGLTVMIRESSNSSAHVFKADATSKPEKQDLSQQKELSHESGSQSPQTVDTALASSEDETKQTGEKETVIPRLFTFENINYTVQVAGEPKRLLNKVNGYVKAGQLTALMGASGAGKTTLLDALSQRKRDGKVDGSMLMNGKPISQSFLRSCGFCMQQDIHEPFTTIREAFQFSAYLRQPAEVPYAEKMAYVEHIISLLELESLADAIIGEAEDGKLNVEERKRVTIGVELAARPTDLLFLDEPTSGLDSEAAYSIVSFLQRIAGEGIPIICTIHQPSGVIFEMFDHVLLLAPGGNTVYFGETGENSRNLVDYFGRYGFFMDKDDNPAEYILSTVTDQRSGSRDWVETWQKSPEAAAVVSRIKSLNDHLQLHDDADPVAYLAYSQSFGRQVYAVTSRHWTTIWRHGQYNFSRFFKCIFYELVVSFTFFHEGTDLQSLQNRMLGILLATWIIPVNAADMQAVWFDRWSIFEGRERNGIYDYKALVIALVVVEIPWCITIYTLVFLCSFWTMGFANTPAIAGFTYFMFLLLSLFGTSFCYLMATFFQSKTTSGYANSLFWVVLLIFCGLPVPHSAMNDFYRPWLFWTDPLRYFFGGTISTVMHNVDVVCKERDYARFIPPSGQTCGQYARQFLQSNPGYLVNPNATDICSYCKFTTGDDYLDTLDFAYGDRWRDWAVFLGFCITNVALVFIGTWFIRIKIQSLKRRFER